MLLTYTELMDVLEEKRIKQKELSGVLGMSRTGFRTSYGNGTFPIKKVPELCMAIGMSPNQLFGIKTETPNNKQTQNGGIGNTQIIEDGISALQEQLKEKDRQIARLLGLLENK